MSKPVLDLIAALSQIAVVLGVSWHIPSPYFAPVVLLLLLTYDIRGELANIRKGDKS